MKYTKKYYKFGWIIIITLLLSLFVAISYCFETKMKAWMEELVKVQLLQDAMTTSNILTNFKGKFPPSFDPEELDPIIDQINKYNKYRTTIINASGAVLADTALDAEQILKAGNYKDKPEFLSAEEHGHGQVIRYSDTLKQEMLYIAVPFKAEEVSGFVRVAYSMSNIEIYTHKLRRVQETIAFIGFIILSVIIAMSYGFLEAHNNLQKKNLREQVKEQTKSLLDIQKFSEMQATCVSIEELAEYVSATAPILFPNSSGALSITHPSNDDNEVISHWGDNWMGNRSFHPSKCWGLRKGAPYISEQESIELKCEHLNISHEKSSICVPLFAQNVPIGALHVVFEKPCSLDVRNRFITIADHLSLAVANMNLRESLKRQAIRDPLTNLYNRRFLDEALRNELIRAERNEQALAILMIDVDHFKKFNDSFGHDAGDYTLQQVGQVLSKLIRGEDIACRFGGEEFMVVLPDITPTALKIRAHEILQAVRDIDLVFKNKPLNPITLSIGVAVYPDHGLTSEELISNADTALYKAKTNGRNQVVIVES